MTIVRLHLLRLAALAGLTLLMADTKAEEPLASPVGSAPQDSAARKDTPGQPAETEPPANSAAGIVDAESSTFHDEPFQRFVDMQLLRRALASRDASLLTDVGLQLAAGEKQLLRPHKATSAGLVLRSAVRLAAEQGDQAALERLSKTAETLHDTELAKQVSVTLKLTGAARSVDSALSGILEDAQPDVQSAVMTALERIGCAKIVGDGEWLKDVDKSVEDIEQFSDEQKAYLKNAAQAAREAVSAETADPDLTALRILAQESRTASGSWRVAGKNERFSLFPAGSGIHPNGNAFRRFTFTYEGLIVRGHGELKFYTNGNPLVVANVFTTRPFLGAELKPDGGQEVHGNWNPSSGPGSSFMVNWTLDGNHFPCTFNKAWP